MSLCKGNKFVPCTRLSINKMSVPLLYSVLLSNKNITIMHVRIVFFFSSAPGFFTLTFIYSSFPSSPHPKKTISNNFLFNSILLQGCRLCTYIYIICTYYLISKRNTKSFCGGIRKTHRILYYVLG